ncbi:hypothetical protein KKH03_04360, partial [Patescibacteria group bacterium]|nr:hypothetical protein [Patescibacteria group bacterium]
MKKGFSVVKIILSVFVLGVIGGGGYTAYKYFTDPAFDFYGLMGKPLIPKVLANNVMGQNADAILLYRSSDDLNTYINSLIPAESNIDIKAEDVLSAIFLVRGPDTAAEFDGAGMAAIEFASVEKSAYVSGQLSALSAFVPIKSDLKDNVLVISVNAEEDTFSGPIGENPLLKKVDPDFVDSQVMLFADTQAFKELQMLFLPIISGFGESMNSSFLQPGDSTPTAGLPVAHAQLISP